jgi:hypothetical protein
LRTLLVTTFAAPLVLLAPFALTTGIETAAEATCEAT